MDYVSKLYSCFPCLPWKTAVPVYLIFECKGTICIFFLQDLANIQKKSLLLQRETEFFYCLRIHNTKKTERLLLCSRFQVSGFMFQVYLDLNLDPNLNNYTLYIKKETL